MGSPTQLRTENKPHTANGYAPRWQTTDDEWRRGQLSPVPSPCQSPRCPHRRCSAEVESPVVTPVRFADAIFPRVCCTRSWLARTWPLRGVDIWRHLPVMRPWPSRYGGRHGGRTATPSVESKKRRRELHIGSAIKINKKSLCVGFYLFSSM